MTVFDASALLAYLRDEPGASLVRERLLQGGACAAANWSEVAQKVLAAGADWALARGLLLSYPLTVEPVTIDDAERAAELWDAATGLSLADRLCLALAERRDTTALTTDAAWRVEPRAELIR
ncbi:PIN domain-containing protein [Agromyces sp. SYSU K20354]|uniref:PIN domain-containing protein n=1 Tax=Agromyces cavernae TaxID=2898659 RepID=UPI001E4286F9|nr:PIN domain-containing protein [Agromyces cavernae]MCD2441456.1 PIN domain-containing protein [Agromyces cavernae]